MNLHTATDRLPTRKERRRQALAAVGGLLLALSVAAGVGLWQLRARSGEAGTGVAQSLRTGVVDSATQPPAMGPVVPTNTVYLVSSPEDADAVRRQPARPGGRALVLTVATGAADQQTKEWLTVIRDWHRQLELPDLQLVDLRPAE